MHVTLILSLVSSSSLQASQLQGEQYCSYRPMAQIYGLYTYQKLQLAKGYECTICSSQKECNILKQKLYQFPSLQQAITGRDTPVFVPQTHFVLGTSMTGPWGPSMQIAMFGMGCFWGVERLFWKQAGVYSTQTGYTAGYTYNPTYQQVCTGFTGHNQVVRVVFDPRVISYKKLLKLFWENHDPTQGSKQGIDRGTQYRSMILVSTSQQRELAEESRNIYQKELFKAGLPPITTEIRPFTEFYFAEEYHQQYLAKNPVGFCGLGGTGVVLPEAFM